MHHLRYASCNTDQVAAGLPLRHILDSGPRQITQPEARFLAMYLPSGSPLIPISWPLLMVIFEPAIHISVFTSSWEYSSYTFFFLNQTFKPNIWLQQFHQPPNLYSLWIPALSGPSFPMVGCPAASPKIPSWTSIFVESLSKFLQLLSPDRRFWRNVERIHIAIQWEFTKPKWGY